MSHRGHLVHFFHQWFFIITIGCGLNSMAVSYLLQFLSVVFEYLRLWFKLEFLLIVITNSQTAIFSSNYYVNIIKCKLITHCYKLITSVLVKTEMNSLKNIFRPTKPISKHVSFKPDEFISNSQKVCVSILLLLSIWYLNSYLCLSVDVGTWSYKTKFQWTVSFTALCSAVFG